MSESKTIDETVTKGKGMQSESDSEIRTKLKLSKNSGDIVLDALIELAIRVNEAYEQQHIDELCCMEKFILDRFEKERLNRPIVNGLPVYICYRIKIDRPESEHVTGFTNYFSSVSSEKIFKLKKQLIAFDVNSVCSTRITFEIITPTCFIPNVVSLFREMCPLLWS